MAMTFTKFASLRSESEAAVLQSLLDRGAKVDVSVALSEALKLADNFEDAQRMRALSRVIGDLVAHGWRFKATDRLLLASTERVSTDETRKEFVQRVQLRQREQQLLKPSVREFVRSMEKRRLTKNGWTSIFSLFRDGRELANALNAAGAGPYVPQVVDPYIQIIEDPEQRCQFSGLRLMDIWRYFRYGWAMPYNSVPGRSMLVLIRDAAARNHPVMGIAALGSAIVQMSERDAWIGWTANDFVNLLEKAPSRQFASWIEDQLNRFIDAIYTSDLIRDAVISRRELHKPTEETIARLRIAAAKAWKLHRRFPNRKDHKSREYSDAHWRRQTALPLFRAKRCETLARLMQARKALADCEFERSSAGIGRLLSKAAGRRAVEILIRATKSEHVGIDMIDITICGAVPPYNPILGGKLVAMLLCSPEIVQGYWKRYKGIPSVIASSMAGKAVCRSPRLVLLGTTSLYGERLNQYHRVQIPAGTAHNRSAVRYEYLGESEGFGSSHLCRETVEELELLLAQNSQGRRVNSIFGEGVSPRLRKIREGLGRLGLPAEMILKHGNRRVVYGIPLADNFREVLSGMALRPRYIIPQKNLRTATRSISKFWSVRWLARRLASRPDVVESVASNDIRVPSTHAARVALPETPEEIMPLFA